MEVRLRPNGVTWKLRVGCVCGIARILARSKGTRNTPPRGRAILYRFTLLRLPGGSAVRVFAAGVGGFLGYWEKRDAESVGPDSRVLEVALLLVAVVGGLLLLSGRAAAIRMLAG